MVNSTPGLIALGILLLVAAISIWLLVRRVEQVSEDAPRGLLFRRILSAVFGIVAILAASTALVFLIANTLG